MWLNIYVAKYKLGKVKLEHSWPAVSTFAARGLQGGPWGFAGVSPFVVFAISTLCMLRKVLVADRIGSLATDFCSLVHADSKGH